MKFHQIIISDTANGVGQRISLFVSGCRNNCPGCHNQAGQDFDFGEEFTEETMNTIISNFKEIPVYSGFTFLGGDPMEPENVKTCLEFAKLIKSEVPDKNIWAYTGYTLEKLLSKNDPVINEFLSYIDVLVDGPFIERLKDVRLNYRGSSNQRIIDVKASLASGSIVELTQYY